MSCQNEISVKTMNLIPVSGKPKTSENPNLGAKFQTWERLGLSYRLCPFSESKTCIYYSRKDAIHSWIVRFTLSVWQSVLGLKSVLILRNLSNSHISCIKRDSKFLLWSLSNDFGSPSLRTIFQINARATKPQNGIASTHLEKLHLSKLTKKSIFVGK